MIRCPMMVVSGLSGELRPCATQECAWWIVQEKLPVIADSSRGVKLWRREGCGRVIEHKDWDAVTKDPLA
jgi:hypothetical protein